MQTYGIYGPKTGADLKRGTIYLLDDSQVPFYINLCRQYDPVFADMIIRECIPGRRLTPEEQLKTDAVHKEVTTYLEKLRRFQEDSLKSGRDIVVSSFSL
ncbi:MAG: hypothetical protein KKF89_00415 [Nanoarchaeota archaeon]|nr:hypothetical protein [Pseudomonadota bacterium]MBU1854159.1 hypothetical protein [Nanoarchaeota archaeon]